MDEYGKDAIIELLMKREGIRREQAVEIVRDCQEAIDEAMDGEEGLDTLEDILRDELGLEPDYVFAFL